MLYWLPNRPVLPGVDLAIVVAVVVVVDEAPLEEDGLDDEDAIAAEILDVANADRVMGDADNSSLMIKVDMMDGMRADDEWRQVEVVGEILLTHKCEEE